MPELAALPSAYPAHRPCPVCGQDCPIEIFNNRLAPLDQLDMSYRISQCGQCGFSYASDLPHSSTYATYYRTMSKYDQPMARGISTTTRRRIEATLALCTPHLPADALIADIGCGSGALLAGFKAAGFSRLYGIDPARGAPREAVRQFGLHNVGIGSLDDADEMLPLGQCDLLCLTGVAEHLPELSKDIPRLLASLSKQCLILIEVPALERFVSPAFEPFGEFSLEHIQYFSQQSLDALMEHAGYTPRQHFVLSCGGCTDSLFGLYARGNSGQNVHRPPPPSLAEYIERSGENWNKALAKVSRHPGQFIIFGAGSHSARLLPALERQGMAQRIIGIVDNNPNLHGVMLGKHRIDSRDFLARYPGMTVLISSFHAQSSISGQISAQHPCLCLYGPKQ